MTNLSLTFQQISGGSDSAPVVAVSDWYDYQDGKRGKRLGSRYTILLLADGCSQLAVKVEDEAPVITQEELDKHNISMNFVLARFGGCFVARPYADRNGQMQLSAKAEQIFILGKDGAAK
jgi:hypothetical protein